ncbi:hypothetical protein J7E63_18040 [Bacillus sp. ISL-75]|uniref:hypothetical protein n=1 Tax=Bacillus sp. ISL-75 TaxID=2819137 RepID=UPI001BE854B5|nr:hypothetical protein [Bacillus sp. ISL-75]MBT2728821.1 hypothetical protein [Bacillus sp. ISL-75]
MERKRYTVMIEYGIGQTEQVIIIASSLSAMFREINKKYGHLLMDENGNETGTIQFKAVNLPREVVERV